MSLGLVLFVIRELRRPENVSRVTQIFAEESTIGAAGQVKVAAQPGPPSSADTFTAAHPVRPESLQVIKDNTYFRNAEKDVWFELIAALRRASPEEVSRGSTGEASYVQLVDQPATYRGKLVTVRGTVRQATQQKPADNESGLKAYYRLVLQPGGGEIWPIFVYVLELPEELPLGDEVAVDVSATGYFFKNLSYRWRDGLGIAPVVLAKQVSLVETANVEEPSSVAPRAPTGADTWDGGAKAAVSGAAANVPELGEVLRIAGWDAKRFAKFEDDTPLADGVPMQLLELLWRMRTFDAASTEAWSKTDLTLRQLIDRPASYPGEMVRLTGRAAGAKRHELSAEDAARLEVPAYFTCEIDTEHGPAIVVAAHVPEAWRRLEMLDEPVSVAGLFINRVLKANDEPAALLVAKRVAWHPTAPSDGALSFGESVLGSLGMDVGLLDDVRSRGAIRAEEREAFYAMLHSVGKIGANQLERFARRNLPALAKQWAAEAQATGDSSRRALGEEVLRRAAEGRYSVAPLFNDPESQIGELVVLEGAVRRAVRVNVGIRQDGEGKSDVPRRFGFDHYYEMELFTDDSQNYPLVFCVRELPAGFPTGDQLHVPVRVAGFFFKDWLYLTRRTATDVSEHGDAVPVRPQYAPLLIGRGPILLDVTSGEGGLARWVGAGLFLLAFSGIWAAAWWFARDDRKFAERTRGRFSLPDGESLNELRLAAPDESTKK